MYTKPMNLDTPLFEWKGSAPNHGKAADLFGIEIELEGQRITPVADAVFNNLWIGAQDGSLRCLTLDDQCIEYRFRKPINFETTDIALKSLEHNLTQPGVVIHDSGRASVHVHVNYLMETLRTVYNAITLSIIFDDLLVSQNGYNRIGNNFCLRAKDAQGICVQAAESIESYGDLRNFNHDHRYSSTNIGSLFKFGSIEYRSMECTVNYARLINWVKVLQRLKEAARTYKSPAEIIDQFSVLGVERFFLQTLGASALQYLKVPDRHQRLFEGVRLAQEFANCATWVQQDKRIDVEPKKVKKITINAYTEALNNIIHHEGLTGAPTPQPPPPMPGLYPLATGNWVFSQNPAMTTDEVNDIMFQDIDN